MAVGRAPGEGGTATHPPMRRCPAALRVVAAPALLVLLGFAFLLYGLTRTHAPQRHVTWAPHAAADDATHNAGKLAYMAWAVSLLNFYLPALFAACLIKCCVASNDAAVGA